MSNSGGFIGDDYYPELESDLSSQFSTHLQNQEKGLYAPRQTNIGLSDEFKTLALNSTLLGDSLAPVDPGNNFNDALYMGDLRGGVSTSFYNGVGNRDRYDIFAFEVSSRNFFNFFLEGLSADADLDLLNADGEIIASANNGSNNSEYLVGQLVPGNYYLGIQSYDRIDTDYQLRIFGGNNAASPSVLSELGINPSLITTI